MKSHLKKEFAKYLFNHMTPAEEALYYALIDAGVHFEPQKIIGGYIVDFLIQKSRKQKFAIEVDGGVHLAPHRQKKDAERTLHLKRHHVRVLRYTNEEVLRDPKAVALAVIKAAQFSEKKVIQPIQKRFAPKNKHTSELQKKIAQRERRLFPRMSGAYG